jgi:two-component system OmpR family response regulator
MAKRVLILDDEPVTTRTLILDLSEAGYEVDRAADADEVVRKLHQSAFDLLIASDCFPGTTDGSELVAACRRARPTAKVLLMTTEGIRDGRVELSENGARVRKPFDLEEFRAVVARVLEVERRSTRGAS